jgi:glycosyltransferase involved in cell wall biosynthesis
VKIGIVAPLVTAIREPQGGGSQAFVADLARGLAGRGHEVHVYAASGSEIEGVTVIDTGIDPRSLASTLYRATPYPTRPFPTRPLPTRPFPTTGTAGRHDTGPAAAAFATVYAAVRACQYDVVHNHAFDAPAVSLATALNAPVVHTLHLPPDPAIAAALRQAAEGESALAVAAVSAFQAAAWRAVARIDAVLPPLVPTRLVPWSAAAGDGAIFAGRLSPEKGTAEAIDIAQAAGMRIDVYGDVYDAEYAREQIGPRRDLPRVAVHPGIPRASLWAEMARAAVVICPARWDEPFGMAAADAQACGTPVVAFRRGGLSEVIADGMTGFLVAPGEIEAAANSVRNVAEISRAACRDHAEKHLDLERSLNAHEQLYRRVISSGGGAAVSG